MPGHVERGVHAVAEVHHRPPGSVVEKAIAVERRDERGFEIRDERLSGGRRAETGVDPPFERDDEHRRVEVGPAVDLVQHRRLGGAHDPRPTISAAMAADRSTWSLNISKPSRPEPIAPAT